MPSFITSVPYTTFSPKSINGCQLWLDGADPAGTNIVPSNGASVTTWTDKSGSNNSVTLTSSTYALNATTGKYGITFSNNPSSALTLTPYMCFFASSYGTATFPSDYRGLLGKTPYVFMYGNNEGTGNFMGAGGGIGQTGLNKYGSITTDARNMAVTDIFCNPPSSFSLFVGCGDLSPPTFPNGNFWLGHIYEVLVYNTTLTQSQYQSIEGYLAQKWGVTSSLPTGHPGLTNTYYRAPTARTFLTKQVYPTGTFTPLSITGCRVWLDASDTSTMTLSGSNVTQWRDKSGSNNHGTGVGTTKPYYANGTMNFVRSTQSCFTLPNDAFPSGNASAGYFVVFTNNDASVGNNANALVDGTALLGGGQPDGTWDCWEMWSRNNQRLYWGLWIAAVATPYTTLNSNTIFSTQYNNNGGGANGIGSMLVNGSSVGGGTGWGPRTQTNNNNYVGSMYRGTAYAHSGTISEVIVYSNALTTTQQQQVEGYLAQKWGFKSSLAAGHPGLTQLFYGTQIPTGITTNFMTYLPKYTINTIFYYIVLSDYWATVWQPYLQQLATANAGATVSSVGAISVSGGSGYNSGCLAPNGYIYFCSRPGAASNVLVFNPTTETVVTTLGSGLTGHHTAILGPNGLIYMFPVDTNSTGILVVDPVAGTANTFITGITSSRYYSGSLAPNGYIYFWTMGGSGTLYKLLPGPNTISTVTTFTGAYNTGSLGPNNCIYLTPESGTGNVLVINTTNDSLSTIGSGLGRFGCLALAPNGYMYGSPIDNLASEPMLIINPTNNSVSTYGSLGGYVQGFTLGANGKLYSAPGSGSYPPYAITPNGTTPSSSSLTTTSLNVYGTILAPNGNIYGVSAGSANQIYAIRFSGLTQLPSLTYCLSSYTNKPSS